jgi:hypothetical protein
MPMFSVHPVDAPAQLADQAQLLGVGGRPGQVRDAPVEAHGYRTAAQPLVVREQIGRGLRQVPVDQRPPAGGHRGLLRHHHAHGGAGTRSVRLYTPPSRAGAASRWTGGAASR